MCVCVCVYVCDIFNVGEGVTVVVNGEAVKGRNMSNDCALN